MNLNENALSILVALTNEPATLKTLSEIIDKSEQQLRALLARLQKDMLIYPTRKRCPISNNVLFDLTDEGRRILGERKEAKSVAQPKKPVKKARVAKVKAPEPAPAQPTEDAPMPEADPVLLASANRMLLDRLHGAALALREFGIPALEKADGAEEIQGFIRLAAASWRERDATPDQILELCEALQVRRILEEVKKVAAIHPAADMPTPFQAAWQLCCEEIFFRATGEEWHMDEDADRFARRPPTTPGPNAGVSGAAHE